MRRSICLDVVDTFGLRCDFRFNGGTSVRVGAFCFVWIAWGLAFSCAAQAQSADADFVKTRLAREIQHLEKERYRRASTDAVWPITRGQNQRTIFLLDANVDYAIIAACDKDCAHVRISLFN